jgi:hypothetical protein
MQSLVEKRAVYTLTGYIDAHERAQKKLHAYLGLEDDEKLAEGVMEEEKKVKEQSAALVYSHP